MTEVVRAAPTQSPPTARAERTINKKSFHAKCLHGGLRVNRGAGLFTYKPRAKRRCVGVVQECVPRRQCLRHAHLHNAHEASTQRATVTSCGWRVRRSSAHVHETEGLGGREVRLGTRLNSETSIGVDLHSLRTDHSTFGCPRWKIHLELKAADSREGAGGPQTQSTRRVDTPPRRRGWE
jgi:hypothetical protein